MPLLSNLIDIILSKFLPQSLNTFLPSNTLSENKDNFKKTVAVINKAICFNQGWLSQYTYLAGEKHKTMKEEYRINGASNINKLEIYKKELESFLSKEAFHCFRSNINFLKEHFKGRRKHEPRVCIRQSKKNIETEEIEIVDLVRDDETSPSIQSTIITNTGFSKVYESGKAYHCNNIPEEIKENRYINPRIDADRIKDQKRGYKLSIFEKFKINKLQKSDEKWIDYWDRQQQQRSQAKDCYKSTLIIPMTLRGNDEKGNHLAQQFRKKFVIEDDDEKAVYGFLCIDHCMINYFNKEIDKVVGYIFADIMSLYQITQLIYMDKSNSFNNIQNIISEKKSRSKTESA